LIRFGLGRFYIPRGNRLQSARLYLQPPRYRDWRAWADLRGASREFLVPWEPTWQPDALNRAA
jgi:ribosomal-protein-alanine N-acetyltransferase